MPLIQLIEQEGTRVAVWKLQEEKAYFINKLHLSEEEMAEYNELNNRKAIEWLITRYLLHLIHPEHDRIIITKDKYGKPYLQDKSYHISLSHSNGYAAAIISTKNVGIDIQTYVDKIYRIKDKFINEEENRHIPKDDLTVLHLAWGGKECIYKGYGKRSVSLRNDIKLELPQILNGESFSGSLETGDYKEDYGLFYSNTDKYMLVYAIEMD